MFSSLQPSKSSTLTLQTTAPLPLAIVLLEKAFYEKKIFHFINKIINKILIKPQFPLQMSLCLFFDKPPCSCKEKACYFV